MKRSLPSMAVLGVACVAALGVARSAGQSQPSSETSPAAATSSHPVAVLDLVRIFNECAQIRDLNETIRQKTEEITKEAEQRRQVIESKQFQLREAFQPDTPDYEVRRKELTRLNIEANVWFKMEEEEIERQRFHWTRIIYQQAVDTAAQVAKDRGFEVVIQRTEFRPFEIEQSVQTLRRLIQERAVIYNAPEIGITDEVIRRLDAGYVATGGKKQLGTATPPTP